MSTSDDALSNELLTQLSSLSPQNLREAAGWLLELAAVTDTARAAELPTMLSAAIASWATWRRAGATKNLRAAETRSEVLDVLLSGVQKAGTGVGVGLLSAFFTSQGYPEVGAALLPIASILGGSLNEAMSAWYVLQADQNIKSRIATREAGARIDREEAERG